MWVSRLRARFPIFHLFNFQMLRRQSEGESLAGDRVGDRGGGSGGGAGPPPKKMGKTMPLWNELLRQGYVTSMGFVTSTRLAFGIWTGELNLWIYCCLTPWGLRQCRSRNGQRERPTHDVTSEINCRQTISQWSPSWLSWRIFCRRPEPNIKVRRVSFGSRKLVIKWGRWSWMTLQFCIWPWWGFSSYQFISWIILTYIKKWLWPSTATWVESECEWRQRDVFGWSILVTRYVCNMYVSMRSPPPQWIGSALRLHPTSNSQPSVLLLLQAQASKGGGFPGPMLVFCSNVLRSMPNILLVSFTDAFGRVKLTLRDVGQETKMATTTSR